MKKENNKGITLIALVITIIVMLILVAVTINVATDGGLIKKAKNAVDQTQRAADWEELQIENAAKAVDGDEFIVEIADKFGNKYKYYRLDKVTEEQREKCRKNGIPVLMGDGNLDGKVTVEDYEVLLTAEQYGWNELTDNQIFLLNLDQMRPIRIEANDVAEGVLDGIDKGKLTGRYRMLCIEVEIGNNDVTQHIIENEENGKLYFIEEEVSEEETKELEKYGVIKTELGDLNLDGKLTQEDLDILEDLVNKLEEANDNQKKLGDMNNDGKLAASDLSILEEKLN